MSRTINKRQTLYAEVTARVIAELEEGRLPWVQPWDSAACACTMPANGVTGRRYSGINVLILWARVIEGGYSSQRWLTYRQAQAAGGNVRKGERGTTVCYADRFTPKTPNDQATERFYHCLLLTLTLYSPKSHKLNFLRSQAEPLVHELIAIWPRDTKFAQRCFELLRQAYVNARYSPHYKVTPAELEWLAERIELLQQIVRQACEKRLAQA